jgi:ParB-like chromosome segregation protein Spo0J
MNTQSLTHTTVPIGSLKQHARNPRRGDVEAIKRSLKQHGQYRSLVVNARTMEVLAGNHTLQGLRELGVEEVAVTLLDVDDEQARKIMLVDNREGKTAERLKLRGDHEAGSSRSPCTSVVTRPRPS